MGGERGRGKPVYVVIADDTCSVFRSQRKAREVADLLNGQFYAANTDEIPYPAMPVGRKCYLVRMSPNHDTVLVEQTAWNPNLPDGIIYNPYSTGYPLEVFVTAKSTEEACAEARRIRCQEGERTHSARTEKH